VSAVDNNKIKSRLRAFGYHAKNWDAQIGVKNITNVTYFTTAQSAGGYVGQPRTFYAKAAWHY
jgi:outer membrane receptor protein involved in Fe transport